MQDNNQNDQSQGIAGLGSPPKIDEPAIQNSHQDQSFKPSALNLNPVTPTASALNSSSLKEIKKNALHELRPLVDQLELTPEEKFKTLIMIIQASDDPSLITKAYEASKQIDDKKEKAQALLDIVNEVNYFSQIDSAEESEQ